MNANTLRSMLLACVLVLGFAPGADAQTYADAQTLATMRQSIDFSRQQIAQLRQMGADAATIASLEESVRFLELQYSSLAGTGPAPGSPEMVAAERRYLESQYRALVAQRNQLAQMGADAASLAMLDDSLRTMRQQIDELASSAAAATPTTPQAGPGYRPFNPPIRTTAWGERVTADDIWRGYNTIGPNGQDCTPLWSDTLNRYVVRDSSCPGPGSNPNGAPDWVATYPKVGPNGQDCTPFYNGQLNRWLVPGGCPMPTGGAPIKPPPGAVQISPPGGYGVTPLPQGIKPGPKPPPAAAVPKAPSTRTPVASSMPTPSVPVFENAGMFAPLPTVQSSTPTPTLSSPPMAGATIAFCGDPNVVYARRPDCDKNGKIIKPGTVASPQGGGSSSASGGTGTASSLVNWGQRDTRPPAIQTQRASDSKFKQNTTISRFNVDVAGCKAQEVRIDYQHEGFLGSPMITGTVTLIGTSGRCPPPVNTRLYMRLEVDGLVGWIEMNPTWTGTTGKFSHVPNTDQAVLRMDGFKVLGSYTDKTQAVRFFTDGVVTGFLVVPPA